MAEILPAILTNHLSVLEQQVRAAELFAPYLHFDITDGQLVPTRSITAKEIQSVHPTVPFEIHLMVRHPDEVLEDYLAIGPSRIIVHRFDGCETLCEAVTRAGVEAALAISPATDATEVERYCRSIRQVTFLAVEPGFQGGALVPGVLQKAHSFRRAHPDIPLEFDGGIKRTNVRQIASCGAHRYAIGSGIWSDPDPAGAYRFFFDHLQPS